MVAEFAAICLTTFNAIMCCYLLAFGAVYAFWILYVFEEFKAGIFSGKLLIEVFYRIGFHGVLQSHFMPALYHKIPLLSRDNCLLIYNIGYYNGYLTGSNNGILYFKILGEQPNIEWEIAHMNDSPSEYLRSVLRQNLYKNYKCDGVSPEGGSGIQDLIHSLPTDKETP